MLKLHRDAGPDTGALAGRLENIASGRHYVFNDANEPLDRLAAEPAAADAPAAR